MMKFKKDQLNIYLGKKQYRQILDEGGDKITSDEYQRLYFAGVLVHLVDAEDHVGIGITLEGIK
jgi:hypothetical protein